MNRIAKLGLMLLMGIVIGACGGGGSSNSPDPAAITPANEADLARAAASAVSQAVAFEDTQGGGFGPALRSGSRVKLRLPVNTSARLAYIPQPLDICDSGSATFDLNSNGSSGVFIYDQCELAGIIISGRVNFSSSTSGNITTTSIEYVDFTTSFEGVTQSLDFSAVCKSNTSTLSSSCTFSSSIAGIDGRTYTVSNATVSGDEFSGYFVSVTIVDPDHGRFSISTTQPITFNCVDADQPDSGQIQFTDAEGTEVTVTYNDCSSFTVAYSGNSTVYNW